jgi:hypothetical protein
MDECLLPKLYGIRIPQEGATVISSKDDRQETPVDTRRLSPCRNDMKWTRPARSSARAPA